MKKTTNQLIYFIFIITVSLKITANNNQYKYSINDIKLGEIDTLKINFNNLSNIKQINWDDLNVFFKNEDIDILQIKKTDLLINEMWYTVQPFDLVDQLFDSIPIKVNLTNNIDTILFVSLKINVLEDINIQQEEFRELKPIITEELKFRISELWTDPFYRTIVIVFLLIIIFSLLIFRYIKKRDKVVIKKNIINSNIDHNYYLDEIQKLKFKNYIEKKQYKLFYTSISEIFRGYLEFRFNISALESTSDDLIFKLNKIKIMEKWMLNFIKESDLVKFAKYTPNKNEELLFISFVENFIKTNIKIKKEK